ncbi:MAG TPA: DKNYY domain-containing protein [Terracidiphilus sp.]
MCITSRNNPGFTGANEHMGLKRRLLGCKPARPMYSVPLFMCALLAYGIVQAQQCADDNYHKTDKGWSFDRKPVEGADVHTFRVLAGSDPCIGSIPCVHDSGYAVDRFHAYWHGELISGADPRTLSYLQFNYSRDATHVYYRTLMVSGADPRTFASVDWQYFKDSAHVYLRGAPIKEADPATFSLLSRNWYPEDKLARDASHVFFGADVVSGADIKDAVYLSGPYWVSHQTIFCEGNRLEQADAASFRIASKDEEAFWAEDKAHYFLRNQILDKEECRKVGPAILACKSYVWVLGYRFSHLDPASLHYLGSFPSQHCGHEGTPLYQDRRGIYYIDSNKILERILHTRQYPRIEHLDKARADRICQHSGSADVWPDGWFDRSMRQGLTSYCPR